MTDKEKALREAVAQAQQAYYKTLQNGNRAYQDLHEAKQDLDDFLNGTKDKAPKYSQKLSRKDESLATPNVG